MTKLKFSPAVETVVKDVKKKSEKTAARSKKADAGDRHWYEVAAGTEITTRTEQAGTESSRPREKRGG